MRNIVLGVLFATVLVLGGATRSKVSTWDGPPCMNMKMTRFARGAKWGIFLASGF